MDQKQNSIIIDLTSDSETDEDTLKSLFGGKKDTSSRLEPRATRSETQAEGGVKQLNATKLSDGRKERESLRQQNGESQMKETHLIDDDDSKSLPKAFPAYKGKLLKQKGSIKIKKTGERCLCGRNDSKLMSIYKRPTRVVNKIKKPLNMKFASEQINKTNNIQVPNTDVNKTIRLNNSYLNVVKSIDSSCSDEVIVIDDDIIINEDNMTTMKAKELLSKVESKTFHSTHPMLQQPMEWNTPSAPLVTSLQRSCNTIPANRNVITIATLLQSPGGISWTRAGQIISLIPIIGTTQGTPTLSKLLEAPANPYISNPPQSTQKNKLSEVGTEKLVNTFRKNTGQDVHMIEISDTEVINKEFYDRILEQFDQKSDVILPEITDLDIEEVIRSIKDNQEIITDEFNVNSLLNDPHSL